MTDEATVYDAQGRPIAIRGECGQPLVITEPLSPEQTKMVDEHMARREAVAKEMEEEKAPDSTWLGIDDMRRVCLEGAGLIEKRAPLPPAAPLALTDRNIAALSRAIEAEGYRIMVDPETGDVKLERNEGSPDEQ